MTSEQDTSSRFIVPTSQPVSVLHTDAARTLTHIHPALLLAYYYFRFPSLVTDPISTLLRDLLPLAAIQTSYAVVCLPLNSPAPSIQSKAKTPKRNGAPSISSKITTAFLALSRTSLVSAPVLMVLMILFGAPLTTHHAQTFLCACHMSLLGVFPLFYVHGVSSQIWWEVGGALVAFDEVWGATVGTVLGAWLGAVPIPLDWDRAWQAWPITILTGAYLGCVLGKLAGGYIFKGKRIPFG